MKTPLDSRSIDASPLVEMNIAIGGEGDAPAKRCGVTGKLSGNIAEYYDTCFYDTIIEDYRENASYTVVDSNFESQTVVGVPIEIDSKYYAPIVIGITKGLYDLYANSDETPTVTISGEELVNDITLVTPYFYADEDDEDLCALVGLVEVDDENSTQLAEDNWETLTIGEDEYPFFNDKSFGPTDLIFTPAPIE